MRDLLLTGVSLLWGIALGWIGREARLQEHYRKWRKHHDPSGYPHLLWDKPFDQHVKADDATYTHRGYE